MRNRYVHTSNKNIQFRNLRNRFSHNTQSTQSAFIPDEVVSLPDDMNFQYDQNNNNESLENEEIIEDNEELSENDEIDENNEESLDDDDNEESSDDEETNESNEESSESSENEETNEDNEGPSENEEMDDNEEENEEEYDNIIDEALDKDKIPFRNNDNEFAPYFENFTTAALFCWLQKHNISTNAYEDLVEIIHNSQFIPAHVIKNVRRFRKWRQHLPLLPISEKSISISSKNTPSTSKNSKMAYQLSINDIIWHVLNNPSLMKHMYFGPDIDSKVKSEYWHGELWGESPFFGLEKITISRETYNSGDFIYYTDNEIRKLGRLRAILLNEEKQHRFKIQKILFYDDLPGIFKSVTRYQKSLNGEIWLQDEPFQMIKMSQILRKTNVVIAYQHQDISEGSLQINEIVYKYQGHWQIRKAELTYQHPSKYITINSPPSNMPVYKLFIDLYYDDFGTYRNVYHSLGGVYLQFGNMPAHQRKLLKNHFVLGFVPFGGNFNEFLQPFISEMKKFEQGKVMIVNDQNAWVIASLGVVTSDLPQGNDMVGVLRHNANRGCRTCTISKNSLTDNTQNIPKISRYHHITDNEFNEILNENNESVKRQLGTKYGLRSQCSILDQLKRERHLQTPQDIYHATAGKIGRLLKLTCELFSQEGEKKFIEIWKNFEGPKNWSRLPNPISHHASFMMSDYLQLAMIMPFLLYKFLKDSSLKTNEIITIQNRIDINRNSVPNQIISCWVTIAKTMKIVFSNKFTLDNYTELQKCLEEELEILPKV
jgi:hypothetical protein